MGPLSIFQGQSPRWVKEDQDNYYIYLWRRFWFNRQS